MPDLEMIRGDTAKFDLAITDEDGVAVDITGASIWLTVKSDPKVPDANAIFQATPSDVSITNGPGGLATITIPASRTESVEIRDPDGLKCYYDIQAKLASNEIYTMARGKLTLLPDITRATS
jgi:hypothetical protein